MTIDMPDVHQADIAPETLDELLRDVEVAAELLGVTVKGGPRRRAADAPVSLAEARQLLTRGSVRGVQLRYRYEGVQWWDTVLRTDGGYRVVRVRHDF